MNPFPRTADLATDLRTAHTLLESKCILYGDTILKQNGLGWKVMALPEQDHLIAAVKGWFYSLALGLAGEMNVEVAKARSQGLEESGGGGGLGEKDVGKVSKRAAFSRTFATISSF
ncbi:hypothetical protein BC936DRAFT_141122 [Jimgerdemannia flammicorona]|uniref:Uncharacterized protein n=1 Tax=Jimgerdemannia flammicorona TaxID=994334 RepID=A0A433A2V4_9FUNG|nr:hypothetical protein BC936DRAFT_141122 [Jimgerdemannia flammicorona]